MLMQITHLKNGKALLIAEGEIEIHHILSSLQHKRNYLKEIGCPKQAEQISRMLEDIGE